MKNKKAAIIPVWVPGLVFISLIVLTTSVIYLNKKITDLPVVGEAQQQVFETAAIGEKALVYADAAASLAAQQAIFDLAYNGGDYSTKQALGFTAWASSEYENYPEEESLKSNFEDSFLNSISSYLALYTEIKLPTDYKITEIGENPMVITGSAFSNIKIEIFATAERLPEVTQPVAPGAVQEIRPKKIEKFTESQAEIKDMIYQIAEKYGVDKNIALAVAMHESSLMQMKKGVPNCNGPSNSMDCGVMQINTKAHPACYNADAKDREICSVEECKGKTVMYDTACNIAAGINFLKQLHERAQKIVDTKGSYVYCRGTTSEKIYNDPWDIALRLYNGPGGCGTRLIAYVETVRSYEKGITAIG
jgi:hypothetical protein